MSKLSGTVLILAGVAVAAHALSSRHDTTAEIAGPRPQSPIGETAAPTSPPVPPAARQAEVTVYVAPSEVKVAQRPSEAKATQPPAPAVAEAPTGTPVFQYKATNGPPLDRAGITKEIQRQLKRASCYHGAIDGVWSPSVRRAMKAFTDRVNAALPIDQPDYVLLAMVQNHRDATCGTSCPAGQALAGDGRCLPNALVARASKRHEPAPQAKASSDASQPAPAGVASAPPAARVDGRMSLAGPAAQPAVKAPAQIKAKDLVARPRHAAPPDKVARPPRYADTSARERRLRRYYYTPPPPFGFPWWGVPGIMP